MRSPAQQRALDRWDIWRQRYDARLAGYHPDVRAEIEATVRERFLAGNFEPLTEVDQRQALMRVASRMRIKRHATAAGADGSGDQLRAIVAELEQRRELAA